MSERISTICVAYTKGVNAQRGHKRWQSLPECPYGATKRELESWWNAGWYDSAKKQVDMNYYKTKAGVVSTDEDEDE